jgi:hypothetical protein
MKRIATLMTRSVVGAALCLALCAAPAVSQEAAASRPLRTPTEAEVADAVKTGVAFLVKSQSAYDAEGDVAQNRRRPRRFKNDEEKKKFEAEEAAAKKKAAERAAKLPPREWPYEGVHRQGDGAIPVGYRVGGTAIVCLALRAAPGFAEDAARRTAYEKGLEFCLDTLEKDPLIQSGFEGTYDTRGWGHTYGLLVCLDALKHDAAPKLKTRAEATAKKTIKTLEDTEIVQTGGWNYARGRGAETPSGASPFMTAPTLQALFQAQAQGFKVKADVVDRALKTLEDALISNGAYEYSADAKRDKATDKGGDTIPGSCARAAACETTLMLAGRGNPERLKKSVDAFFAHWGELEKRRAQSGTHIPPYMIAPYYFHYGHTYVAQAIEFLPEAARPAYREKLRGVYWLTREQDGTWNDRVFPRSASFGTAMSLLGLLAPTLPKPAPRA